MSLALGSTVLDLGSGTKVVVDALRPAVLPENAGVSKSSSKLCSKDAPRSFFAWIEPASAASRNLERDLP